MYCVWHEEDDGISTDELKAALARAAARGRSEAELVREAVRKLTQRL